MKKEDICLSPVNKSPYTNGKAKWHNKKRHKMYIATADRLRTVCWSNYSHHIDVVNRFTGLTFPLPTTALQSKGNTWQNLNNPTTNS